MPRIHSAASIIRLKIFTSHIKAKGKTLEPNCKQPHPIPLCWIHRQVHDGKGKCNSKGRYNKNQYGRERSKYFAFNLILLIIITQYYTKLLSKYFFLPKTCMKYIDFQHFSQENSLCMY